MTKTKNLESDRRSTSEATLISRSRRNTKNRTTNASLTKNRPNSGSATPKSKRFYASYCEHDRDRQKIIRDTNKRHQEILVQQIDAKNNVVKKKYKMNT